MKKNNKNVNNKNAKHENENAKHEEDEFKETDNITEPEEEIIEEALADELDTEELQEKIDSLSKEVADYKDKMLRLQADTDNYRKRMLREKEDAVIFANEKIITELLSFIDNLDRAIDACKNGGDISSLTEGVSLIKDQLLSALSKNWGLEKIETENAEFNPEEHEACMAETDPELEKEMVVLELQTGYKLHGRVIRPAKVKIAKP